MSFQQNFTSEEWICLKLASVLASTSIILAGPTSLTQNLLELLSVNEAIKHPEGFGELVAELAASLKTGTNADHLKISGPAEVKTKALEICQQATALLKTKVSQDEALQYRKWILFVASKVAKAAKEGSFFGIGGKRVSHAEELVLNELTQALDLDAIILAQFLAEQK